jgi:hypothetical protein
MERENLALGRLDGLARLLPDLQLFLYFYVRKEAVLSSQIEGTQSKSTCRNQCNARASETGNCHSGKNWNKIFVYSKYPRIHD